LSRKYNQDNHFEARKENFDMSGLSFSLYDLESFAQRFYENKVLSLKPYTYRARFDAAAQGVPITQIVSIAANADFLCTALSYQVVNPEDVNDSTDVIALASLNISDTATNEGLSNQDVDINNLAGRGFDKQLVYPQWYSGRSAVNVLLTNRSPTALNLDLVFKGVLIRVLQ
jgi:hypothetical protein